MTIRIFNIFWHHIRYVKTGDDKGRLRSDKTKKRIKKVMIWEFLQLVSSVHRFLVAESGLPYVGRNHQFFPIFFFGTL